MPAQRRSFTDALDSIIYWETSFVKAYFDAAEPYHDQCVVLAQRLENESVLSVSSDFTHTELSFIVMRDALIDEGRRRGQHWLDVKRANPALLLAMMPTVLARRDELNRLTFQLPIGDAVNPRAYDLMTRYPLFPTDAYHIATALESGVVAIATLDSDFLTVEGIIIFTCLP